MEPRTSRSPDTERARSSIGAVATTSTSPDIDSTATGPPSTWTRMSPDAVAHRLSPAVPFASTSPLRLRNDSAAARGTSISRSGA